MRSYISFDDQEGVAVEIEYKVLSEGHAGQYGGRPENCYPAEGPEIYLLKVLLVDEDGKTTKTDVLDRLSDSTLEDLADEAANFHQRFMADDDDFDRED